MKPQISNNLAEDNLRLLLDTIEGINQTNEFKTVLHESMEATRLVMHSEASSLILTDQDKGELFISMPTGPAKKQVLGKSIPMKKGIAGWVAENRRPYLSNDVSASEHFYGDIAKDFKTRNMLCIPLINRANEVIGVLQAINRRKDADFTPHDIPVFQALGSHITVAIERTRQIDNLHQKLKQKDAAMTQLHHRIAEGFRGIQQLVNEEVDSVKELNTKELLEKVKERIREMKKMHERVLEGDLDSSIELGFYLGQLTERINVMLKAFGLHVKVNPDSAEINIKQERALLCGLILNELLINVYQNSISNGDGEMPAIIISFSEKDGNVRITVSDEGLTLPEDLDLNKKQSIGLWLADDLLNKLKGTIQSANRKDERFIISFGLSE